MKYEKIILFCIPYAGGSAAGYYKWKRYFEKDIELYAIELAGRGSRVKESKYIDFKSMIEDIYTHICQVNSEQPSIPFIIFGHSMGGLLAYEVSQKLLECGNSVPVHIILSGCMPPNYKSNYNISLRDDESLIKSLIPLGGMSQDIINNSELRDLFLPIIKSDYQMFIEYSGLDHTSLLPCNISVLYGRKDPMISEIPLKDWGNHTMNSCDFYSFEGDHFYLNTSTQNVIRLIKNISQKELSFLNGKLM